MSPYASMGTQKPGGTRAVRVRFAQGETAQFYRSLRERAKLADTPVMLWAATRMIDRILGARGASPVHFLAPVPVTLDPPGERQRMFGNHLTMMMLELDRDDLGDEGRALGRLASQRREIVRDKLDVAMVAALAVARRMPARLYNWSSRRPFGGERSSLVLSNPGELAIDHFAGVKVSDAYTVPAALVPPGFQLIASRHGGCLSITVVFVDGAVSEREVRDEIAQFKRDLVGDTQ
jgi:hypothetical protein